MRTIIIIIDDSISEIFAFDKYIQILRYALTSLSFYTLFFFSFNIIMYIIEMCIFILYNMRIFCFRFMWALVRLTLSF